MESLRDKEKINEVCTAEGDAVQWYLKQAGAIPLLTKKEETELAYLVQDGDQQARQKLICSNLKLVISQAKKYMACTQSMTLPDLIQEGNLGLIKAVEKYDPSLGFRFSTYATWWIRQAITRAIYDSDKIIRCPAHFEEDMRKLRRAAVRLHQRQSSVTQEELAAAAGFTKEKIAQMMMNSVSTVSLNTPIGNENAALEDFVEDFENPSTEELVLEIFMQREINRQMSCLNSRERTILNMRFGLNGYDTYTLEQVGKHIGVTRERIRQIEKKALQKMRNPKRSRYLKEFLYE